MKISVLSSGSSGNCFYIENKDNSILVDAGISCKQIVERMNRIKKNPADVKGIFITHEHSDHIKGADVFAREFNLPIFVNKKTSKNCFLCSNESLINTFKTDETTIIGGMEVRAFEKSHLGAEPVSYSITNGKKISIITDAGYACKNIVENVSDSDFLCLESNHDIDMLDNGPYPWHLKKWVRSDKGHLSNMQASLCVMEHAPKKLKNIVLSHLSLNNNTPKLALDTARHWIGQRADLRPKISVSNREFPTSLFSV